MGRCCEGTEFEWGGSVTTGATPSSCDIHLSVCRFVCARNSRGGRVGYLAKLSMAQFNTISCTVL